MITAFVLDNYCKACVDLGVGELPCLSDIRRPDKTVIHTWNNRGVM